MSITKEQVNLGGAHPLISVIVPVYKVEKYIRRCLDSIVGQTYKNLEIILVDDGSPDLSGEICDEYAVKDNRIRVIHQENQGVSAARNAGLDICTGEYIAFVDSDDYIENDMIQQLLNGIENAEMCGVGTIQQDFAGTVSSVVRAEKPLVYSGVELLRNHYSGENGRNNITITRVCGMLFRNDVFFDQRFRLGIFFEDMHIAPYLFIRCAEVRYLPYAGYHYITNPSSITNNQTEAHLKKCYEDCFAIWEDHELLYKQYGLDDLILEVKCTKVDKVITQALAGNIPQGCEVWSKKLLRQTLRELITKTVGSARKLRYMAFYLFGARGYRMLRKIIK